MTENNTSTFVKIVALLSEYTDRTVTTDSKLLDDLGLDSLAVVAMMLDLEDIFSVEIEPEDYEGVTDMKGVVALIDDKLKEKDS